MFCNEILEITEKNMVELNYLTELAKKLEVVEAIKESFFQFSPTFDDKGRNQTFATFYKEHMLSEIAYKVIFLYLEKEYNNKFSKDIIEDMTLLIYDKEILDLRENSKIIQFFLKTDLSNMPINTIINTFENKCKEIIFKLIQQNFKF